ncbi:MAG TPA: NADH-ubiquinone oxidoreductase subunit NDUFA12 family protein [Candidatus Nitrosotenuis sp.]|jgi:NADH:ubiquinone oxidoreductase subunit|nr:NADH-ubiquinone oxidoreductase subunit NDUFA12 family protein [Candidatus Nitrosotenuis sp.]
MSVQICLLTWWRGQLVGEDEFGNRYFQDRKPNRQGKIRRWVIYKGRPEASKVPADWHGWLHYTVNETPKPREKYAWEKPHIPNLTGTPAAYKPTWDKKSKKSHQPKDYEPWSPE